MENVDKLKFLVADEDKDVRFLIQVYLRDYAVDLIEARNGNECLELARKENPDLIILNSMLDKMSGYQVAKEISEEKELKGIRIIMMTLEGFDLMEENTNIDEYLAKPFKRNFLIDAIKKVCGEDILKEIEKSRNKIIHEKKEIKKVENVGIKNNSDEKKKILVAEDDVAIAKLIQVILSKEYELDVVYTGEELVGAAGKKEYDLIISDVVMPKLSGWKSVKKIRENGCNAPVIFNSGLVKDKELYETLKPEGISCFILKPFRKEELIDCVKKMFELM